MPVKLQLVFSLIKMWNGPVIHSEGCTFIALFHLFASWSHAWLECIASCT